MSIETLGALFNSPARVKILRLFLLNPTVVLTPALVSARSNVSSTITRKEINILSRAGFIARKKERRPGKKSLEGWGLALDFEYIEPLEKLLFGTEFIDLNDLGKRFKSAGKIKLLLLSGVFTRSAGARLDLLIVGDNLKRPVLDKIIRQLEAEIGKELAYAAFETPDFVYRASMYDKLIRDVIDFPHEQVVNVGSLLNQVPSMLNT